MILFPLGILAKFALSHVMHACQILIEVDELPETKYPISCVTEEEQKE